MTKEQICNLVNEAYAKAINDPVEGQPIPSSPLDVACDTLADLYNDFSLLKKNIVYICDMITITKGGKFNEHFRASSAVRALSQIALMDENEMAQKFKAFSELIPLIEKYENL